MRKNFQNNLKIKLDTKLMTNIDPVTHKPIFTNGDLSSQVELPDGVPFPIMKCVDGASELTVIDGTETDEFIPTGTATQALILANSISKVSAIENGICVTGKKASEILPFAAADFVPAEITYENAPEQLVDLVDTGEKLSNFAIAEENYIIPTGETDDGCIVIQLPVAAGVYTIKFPDSKVGITVDFWSRCGGIVISKAVATDITESGFLEFAPADIVLIDSWTDSAIEKHTKGNDHYAQISVPTGGAFLYVQYAYKNGTTQYFDRIEVYNATYENVLNPTTEAGNSYISKIGDWYVKDTEARSAIESLKAEIATLRAALAEVKEGGT